MDVANTLIEVIGLAYPAAKMGQEPGAAFVLIVDDEDRAPRTKVGKRAAARAFQPRETPEDDETLLLGFDGTNLRVSAPEVLCRHLAEVGGLLLESMAGATNYVEIPATHPDFGSVVITVRHAEGKTPATLRREAEARADHLAMLIARLTDEAKRGPVTDERMRELLGDG